MGFFLFDYICVPHLSLFDLSNVLQSVLQLCNNVALGATVNFHCKILPK